MHVIWNLLRTELSAHATMLRSFAAVAAIISAMNLAMSSGSATSAIAVCILTVAFLPSVLFAQDERAHLDTMYSILPVTRVQFVLARYLLVVLVTVAATLMGLVVARIGDVVRDPGVGALPLSTAGVAGLAVAVLGVIVAIQLLLFFSLGYTRTGMYAYGATMVLMFASGFLIQRFPDMTATIIQWVVSSWTGVLGPGIAVAVLAVSAAGSVRLYQRRNL